MNIFNDDFDLASLAGPQLTIKTSSNGPPLWNELLRQLPGGIVAGGAVRDWFFGIEPKDIDIFFPHPVSDFPFPGGFHPLGGDRADPKSERAVEYTTVSNITLVERGVFNGLQIDLIFLSRTFEHPRELLELFDFGVTRSAFHPDYGLIDTQEALLDRGRKTVTLMLNDRPERAQARFDRFNERMGGGWTFVK